MNLNIYQPLALSVFPAYVSVPALDSIWVTPLAPPCLDCHFGSGFLNLGIWVTALSSLPLPTNFQRGYLNLGVQMHTGMSYGSSIWSTWKSGYFQFWTSIAMLYCEIMIGHCQKQVWAFLFLWYFFTFLVFGLSPWIQQTVLHSERRKYSVFQDMLAVMRHSISIQNAYESLHVERATFGKKVIFWWLVIVRSWLKSQCGEVDPWQQLTNQK